MHAVIPFRDRLEEYSKSADYILCHVRRVEKKDTESSESSLKECVEKHLVDFYKLFALMHNYSLTPQKTDIFSH